MVEDAVEVIVDLLKNSWNASNTDNRTPYIDSVYNVKRDPYLDKDGVFVYSVSHTEKPASLGFTHIDYTDIVSIDIRTTLSRQHLMKLRDEVRRIIYSVRSNGQTGYKYVAVGDQRDRSDRTHKLWRYIIDVKLWKVLDAVQT